MFNYEAVIGKPAEVKQGFNAAQAEPRKLRLAEQLIDQWHEGKFDFSKYKDRYQEKVREAIAAKEKGEEITALEVEEPEVINLMDALKRSVVHEGSKQRNRRSKVHSNHRKHAPRTAHRRRA
jgi:DNA end-binding protein Ku